MTDADDFLWAHAPFWIAIYVLGIVTWSCVGRFLLAWFVPAIHPANYIWRGFVFATDWAIGLCAFVTPRYVRRGFMPLVTFFWLYWRRHWSRCRCYNRRRSFFSWCCFLTDNLRGSSQSACQQYGF